MRSSWQTSKCDNETLSNATCSGLSGVRKLVHPSQVPCSVAVTTTARKRSISPVNIARNVPSSTSLQTASARIQVVIHRLTDSAPLLSLFITDDTAISLFLFLFTRNVLHKQWATSRNVNVILRLVLISEHILKQNIIFHLRDANSDPTR